MLFSYVYSLLKAPNLLNGSRRRRLNTDSTAAAPPDLISAPALFSTTCELPLKQVLSFDTHMNCRGYTPVSEDATKHLRPEATNGSEGPKHGGPREHLGIDQVRGTETRTTSPNDPTTCRTAYRHAQDARPIAAMGTKCQN